MANDKEDSQPKDLSGALNKFEPGAALGPIENRIEYEQRLDELPPEQKQLAQESTRFADFCQYFSRRQMDIPSEIVEQVAGLSRLTTAERIESSSRSTCGSKSATSSGG